jgi:hypothetical protein
MAEGGYFVVKIGNRIAADRINGTLEFLKRNRIEESRRNLQALLQTLAVAPVDQDETTRIRSADACGEVF